MFLKWSIRGLEQVDYSGPIFEIEARQRLIVGGLENALGIGKVAQNLTEGRGGCEIVAGLQVYFA